MTIIREITTLTSKLAAESKNHVAYMLLDKEWTRLKVRCQIRNLKSSKSTNTFKKPEIGIRKKKKTSKPILSFSFSLQQKV